MNNKVIVIVLVVGLFVLGLTSAAAQAGSGRGPCVDCGAGAAQTGNRFGQSVPKGQGNNQANAQNQRGLLAGLPAPVAGEVPDTVIAAMTAGYLDEYQANATYQVIMEQFGAVAPFVNIQRAETQHLAAWEFLFERYAVPLPLTPAAPDNLSFASLTDACEVAAAAEIANTTLYDELLVTLAGYPDMVQVATNLQTASLSNHLPAFQQCAG